MRREKHAQPWVFRGTIRLPSSRWRACPPRGSATPCAPRGLADWCWRFCSLRGSRAAASQGCGSDLRLLLGACVSPAVAAQACGAAAIATLDGCAARPPCEAGRARDLDTGECLPRRDTRAIATSLGILVGEDELVAC